jgi:hypothetical protein
MNEDIDAALRRLDRPLQSERSAARRQLMLAEFDTTFGRGDGWRAEFDLESAPEYKPTSRPWTTIWGTVAAGVVLLAGLVLLARPSPDPADPASTPADVSATADPVVAVMAQFCDDELSDVGSALDRYHEGALGAGGNVAPLKRAIIEPVEGLLDDVTRLGVTGEAIDALRADLDALNESFLRTQVQTRVAGIYADLGVLIESGILPGSDACDTQQLRTP